MRTRPVTVRVNLCVPAETDRVLRALAQIKGVSKSYLVMDQLARALPYWRAELSKLSQSARSSESGVRFGLPPGCVEQPEVDD